MSKNEELEKYKTAVWDFMLEHCDIQKSGAFFIKFHCDGQKNFENRIAARLRGYHRTDVVARRAEAEQVRQNHKLEKREVKENYRRLKKVRAKFGRFYPLVKFLYEKK